MKRPSDPVVEIAIKLAQDAVSQKPIVLPPSIAALLAAGARDQVLGNEEVQTGAV